MIRAALSEQTKTAIYRKWLTGKYSLKEISVEYHIAQPTVSRIVSIKLKKRKVKI